jgi:hypothetical protein
MTQARSLIRSIEITYIELPKSPRRAFEIIEKKQPGNPEQRTVYSTTEEAMSDPVSRDRLIGEAIRQLQMFRRRFAGLRELEIIFNSIDETVEKLASDTVSS